MLTLAILAGGKSLRMGKNKSMVKFLGKSLVRRILDRLEGLAEEVIIVGPESKENLSLNIKIVSDLFPGRGSLGGVYTALYTAIHPAVAVVACDMPFVNAELLANQRNIFLSEKVDVVIPASEKGLEPLHAIYRRVTCLPPIREAIEAGEQRLISWFNKVNVHTITIKEANLFDPHNLSFINVNTPEELAQAEILAREIPG